MVLLLAASCGLIVANIYYAQPLISTIAPAIGLDVTAASLIVTLTQIGYCTGLILLVPLGDLLENRRLIVVTVCGAAAALALAASADSAPRFLLAALCIGLGSVSVQMLVPVAANLAPDAIRGRVVGNVMSGLLIGIMLARPVASSVSGTFGWRTLFTASSVLMLVLAAVLWRLLPRRQPHGGPSYPQLIGSLWTLLRDTPLLRRRAAYQAAVFAAFSLYWTAVPLLLAGPRFHLGPHGIALFMLAGVAGSISAPIAGRLADQGRTYQATGFALAIVGLSFVIGWIGSSSSLTLLVLSGIVLDFGVQGNQVVSQRAIYALGPEIRSRLNGLYMAMFFLGGAGGSAVASIAYARGGWTAVCGLGIAFALAALALFATESRPRASSELAGAVTKGAGN
jgi:predicted MFS family arabinose efflux permease